MESFLYDSTYISFLIAGVWLLFIIGVNSNKDD